MKTWKPFLALLAIQAALHGEIAGQTGCPSIPYLPDDRAFKQGTDVTVFIDSQTFSLQEFSILQWAIGALNDANFDSNSSGVYFDVFYGEVQLGSDQLPQPMGTNTIAVAKSNPTILGGDVAGYLRTSTTSDGNNADEAIIVMNSSLPNLWNSSINGYQRAIGYAINHELLHALGLGDLFNHTSSSIMGPLPSSTSSWPALGISPTPCDNATVSNNPIYPGYACESDSGEVTLCMEFGGFWDPYNCECVGGTPILVDLGEPGLSLTSFADGVRFDLYPNGRRERMAWTAGGAADGFLILDRNGNGQVDGRSDPFELFSLDHFEIVAIELDYRTTGRQDRYGNLLRLFSFVHFRDKPKSKAVDVIFAYED